MSAGYTAVGWNSFKKQYDAVLLLGVVLYLAVFMTTTALVRPEITAETLIIRAFGTCALIQLHLILMIGPLARLNPYFLPLLYNRRHFGVVMFLTALVHGGLSLVQFHFLGDVHPLQSLFTSGGAAQGVAGFPFQPLGFAALVILFLMAATSHDFWLANLSAPVWKRLHVMVYAAYGLLILHVLFGVVQVEDATLPRMLLGLGCAVVVGLHIAAALRPGVPAPKAERWVPVCAPADIPHNRARIVKTAGARVAVFRHDGGISAVSSVCRHQGGPLGEGKVIDGCITCPWHGYQYRPADGCSPPPFKEKVPTYAVKIEDNMVYIAAQPSPDGTYQEPAPFAEAPHA